MSRKFNYFGFFILALILLAACKPLNSKDSKTEDKLKIGYLPGLEHSKKLVLSHSKLNFSEITDASGMDKSELPQELQHFVFGKLINQTYQSIQYSGGKDGYLIEYALNASDYEKEGNLSALYWLSKEYIDFAKASRWNTAYLSRTDLFTLVEVENSQYKVRIEQSLDPYDKETISVLITIATK